MRASSLSNDKVIDLLNHYFVAAHADGVYYETNKSVAKEEKAAYAQVFQKLHRFNKELGAEGKPTLSIGTVHAYVFTPDGQPMDSLHVGQAGPERVIGMLKKAIQTLKVGQGKPVVAPAPLSIAPKADVDALVLHLTARYLVPKGQSGARKDIDDAWVPAAPTLGGERSGQWDALPSEDWIVLKQDQWRKLLPKRGLAVGGSWELDQDVAAALLTRFYPTTENNDLSTNHIDKQTLKGTVVSIQGGIVRARLDGALTMKHAFYPNRKDPNTVEATVIGYVDFQEDLNRIRTFRLVTEQATYGGPTRHFGVALRSMPGRGE